jgi:ribonucleoside-diphosphate reductase alpha chain
MYVTINVLDGKPFEVFITVGKSGSCIATTIGALAISISHGLRAGIPLEEYKKALIGAQCLSPLNRIQNQGRMSQSCIDSLARTFKEYLELKEFMVAKKEYDPTPKSIPDPPKPAPAPTTTITTTTPPKPVEKPALHKEMTGKVCKECGGPVYMSEGCDHCALCGHSEQCE